MRPVVGFSSNHCVRCLNCLKACELGAITITNGTVKISSKDCINCGDCLKACTKLGLEARGSTLVDLANYDYTICLVPSALLATQNSDEKISRLLGAIKLLGFNEVIPLSDYEGKVYKETLRYVLKSEEKGLIASFCPVVNDLVIKKYPSLKEKLVKIDYPASVAAKDLRKKYPGKVGIFYLAECIAKLSLGKYPYGADSEIDHTLSIMDLFPLLNANKDNEGIAFDLANLGIVASASHLVSEKYKSERILVASGKHDSLEALELAEFEKLNEFDLLYLFKCSNGCINGELLFGNQFTNKKNVLELASRHLRDYHHLDDLSLLARTFDDEKDDRTMKEKLAYFKEVEKVMKNLPGYNCGACGYKSCNALASDIVKQEAKLSYCKVLKDVK